MVCDPGKPCWRLRVVDQELSNTLRYFGERSSEEGKPSLTGPGRGAVVDLKNPWGDGAEYRVGALMPIKPQGPSPPRAHPPLWNDTTHEHFPQLEPYADSHHECDEMTRSVISYR